MRTPFLPIAAHAPRPERDLRRDPPGHTDASRAQFMLRLWHIGEERIHRLLGRPQNGNTRASSRRQVDLSFADAGSTAGPSAFVCAKISTTGSQVVHVKAKITENVLRCGFPRGFPAI